MIKRNYPLKECDPILLCHYFDRELGPEDKEKVDEHLKTCPSCQKALQDHQLISAHFKADLKAKLSKTNLDLLEKSVLNRVQDRRVFWWTKISDLLFLKRVYIPTTAVAAALVIFFTVLYYPASPSGPSAIVTSLTGQSSSVMIFETLNTQQTILWFKEELPLNGEDDAIQDI